MRSLRRKKTMSAFIGEDENSQLFGNVEETNE
jgi:hypothetical protein